MKRVAVISASRADAGVYIPVIAALKATPNLRVGKWTQPDVVVVLGDTMPMLEAAINAAEDNVPLCHIHGGDTTGSIDNKIRDAITAFADWHFPSLITHANRLMQMGVPRSRIKVVGPLGIYAMKAMKDAEFLIAEQVIRQSLGLSDKPIVIVLQHPVSTERAQAGAQMRETMEAVSSFGDICPVVIHPNGEEGSESMLKVIRSYRFPHFGNLDYLTFVSLLKASACIVGNSSCGLVEAPLFDVACVNVGTRQTGRVGGTLTRNVDYASWEIQTAIKQAMQMDRGDAHNPYAFNVDGPGIIARTIAEEV